MGTVISAAVAAALVSTGVIAVFRRVADHAGLVDAPCERRRHKNTTPVVGGIGIVLGFLAAASLVDGALTTNWDTLLAGIALLAIVGTIDDALDVSSRIRLLTQFSAVVLVLWVGDLQITQLGDLLGFGPIGLWVVRAGIHAALHDADDQCRQHA